MFGCDGVEMWTWVWLSGLVFQGATMFSLRASLCSCRQQKPKQDMTLWMKKTHHIKVL